MKCITVKKHLSHDDALWDEFAQNCPSGHFMHSRRFISYHGDKFHDESIQVAAEGELIGVVPAARDPLAERTVVSHPGLSFGGLIMKASLPIDIYSVVIQTLLENFAKQGYLRMRVKQAPSIFHSGIQEDALYAMTAAGFKVCRQTMGRVIDLAYRHRRGSRRIRSCKKALSQGFIIKSDQRPTDEFWSLLEANLTTRHNVQPVHDYQQICELAQRFPRYIEQHSIYKEDQLLGGVVLFLSGPVMHCQYIAASELGSETCALDYLLESLIEAATTRGYRYFSLGISNEGARAALNIGLDNFKREFGAGALVYSDYEIELN